ncbi:MAG: hypothetical protein ABSH34_36660, partial [Verrucomicrobiota bacterium]
MSLPTEATNTAMLIDPQESALARYIPSAGVYKCPGDKSKLARSVSMNCRLNPTRIQGVPAFMEGGNSPWEIFRKLPQIQTPQAIFVILDERSDSINDGYFAVDMTNT